MSQVSTKFIANNAVTNAKLAQAPSLTLKGNNTGGTANELDLTVAQVLTMLGPIPVANGGTGASTLAQYGVLIGEGTSAVTSLAASSSGQLLVSNGTSNPMWASTVLLGVVGTTAGVLELANISNTNVIAISGTATSSYTFNLPATAGTAGQVLTSQAGGTMTWTNVASNGFTYLSSNTSVYGGTNTTLSFTGADNTVVGVAAGTALSSGANNVLVGASAGAMLNTGGNNVCIGYQASDVSGATSVTETVAIGASSQASGTGSIAIGYVASDAGNANSTVLGQAAPGTSNTGCFLVGQTTTGVSVVTSTASGQIAFGTAGTHAITLQDMYLGRGAVGDGTATNVSIQPSPMVGSNLAGASLTIRGGNSTGTGAGGSVIIQTAPASGSSSTANTLTTAVTVDSTQNVTIAGLAGTGTRAVAATSTGLLVIGTSAQLLTSSGIRAGQTAISSGVTTTGTITFSSTLGTTSYAVTATLVNTTDTNPQYQPITITAQTATGFTASWNAPTATANYVLNWHAILNN